MKQYAMFSCFCEEVIISTLELRGTGVGDNPYRRVTQVFTKAGELIAEYDPLIKKVDAAAEIKARVVMPTEFKIPNDPY